MRPSTYHSPGDPASDAIIKKILRRWQAGYSGKPVRTKKRK
jgi:hypothetical protein